MITVEEIKEYCLKEMQFYANLEKSTLKRITDFYMINFYSQGSKEAFYQILRMIEKNEAKHAP